MKTYEQVRHYLNNIIAGELETDPELDSGHPMGPEYADAMIDALEWALEVPSESRTRLYLKQEKLARAGTNQNPLANGGSDRNA